MFDDGPDGAPPVDDPPALAYAAVLIAYVALGYFLKSIVLNWVVGPLFLLAVLHLVPAAMAGRRRRSGR